MRETAERTAWIGTLCLALAAFPSLSQSLPGQAQPPDEIPAGLFDELTARHIGPLGNRVVAVTGVAGDPNVYYAGAASGGIFKTTDGGAHWQPIFDRQRVASIGALAVAPSDPNVVWAGTGETFLRANVSIGDGIYRSTDGGETWEHRGLAATGRIGRVIVHPTDPDVVWVAALGHCYGPQEERGVYRTEDGGDTWQHVLFAGEDAGASDLVIDPTNPRILFAGTWEIHLETWGRQSGGAGSGLWTSRDGGDTWKRLAGNGLPEPPWGKIGLAMSAADPERVYALIETSSNRDFAPADTASVNTASVNTVSVNTFQGVLWRSEDGGATWEMVSADNNLVQRPLYYSRAVAAPDDAERLYFLSVRHRTSLDGGKTSFETEEQPGWDHHDMWIDPRSSQRMIVGHDGGVSISTTGGRSWWKPQLPIAQMYHANVDTEIPYRVCGNRQDGAAMCGPSNSLTSGDIPIGSWRSVGGCEVGFAVPVPGDPDVVWAGCYDGLLERYDRRTGHARDVSVWPAAVESWPAADLKYRFQWTFPIVVSPHRPETVYVGSQFVHRTTDGGQSWEIVSGDLTTDAPELQRRTGGLTLDDAGPTIAPAIFALAESPIEEGVIWAGTNDGQVQVSRDGGGRWTNVTAALPDLPPRGTVSNVEPSRHRPGTTYLTVDRHQLNDPGTYVYKTADGGRTWRSLRGDLPQDVFAYAHCVREDPVRPGLLYLGTENALWVSFDDGGRWHRLGKDLPPAPVHWLVVEERFNDLVIATYGRGFWILDDLTPLQQLDAELLESEAVLLQPRPAWRFRHREPAMSHPDDPAAGENPAYGATIHFYLKSAAAGETEGDSDGTVELRIRDPLGAVVRTLDEVPQTAGLHRIHWDLRYDETTEVKLRTPPEENPHIGLGDEGWRPLKDGGRIAVLAPPGSYTVELSLSEKTFTQRLEVRKDPGSAGSEDDVRAQMEVLFGLRDMLNASAAMINEIEWARKALGDLEARLAGRPELEEVGAAMAGLEAALAALEGRFFDLRLTGALQDTLRWKRLLYARIHHLARLVGKTDFPPTAAQLAVYRELGAELDDHRRRFAELEGEVAAFNERLRDAGIAPVVLGGGDVGGS